MFAADLSWTDHGVEKVGERRVRKERQRRAPSVEPSGESSQGSKSSRSSIISNDRETWWPASLKKAKAVKSNARPTTSADKRVGYPRKLSNGSSKPAEIEPSLKDPSLQPEWTYSSSLRPTLPSGAPIDPPSYELPELESDTLSRRRANSKASYSSNERQAEWKSLAKVNVIEEVHEVQQLSPKSFIARTTRRSSESIEAQHAHGPASSPQDTLKGSYSVEISGSVDVEHLTLDEEPRQSSDPRAEESTSLTGASSRLVAWRPPTNWNILPNSATDEKELPPLPAEVTQDGEQDIYFTRFSRFIRRMENAGSRMIIERLKGEWQGLDEEADDGWKLEKQLWLLTAFQLQCLNKSVATPPLSRAPAINGRGKILELYGDLAEVYQLAAMRPGQKIHYLSTNYRQTTPLPANVTYLTVPQAGAVPLPYPASSFSHIRASTLPSLIPSSKLPQIFRECHRLLAPGGVLEIRIMDASPIRRTAGPKMRAWIEDRVSLNLERLFRCSKPCLLVPNWVTDAGFEMRGGHPSATGQMMQMPCAFNKHVDSVDDELAMLIGRALWKDIWGGVVEEVAGEARWWWEDGEILRECEERGTVFECGALVAVKR